MCEKIAYPDYKTVNNAVVALNKQRKYKYKSYKCDECGAFHITTINKHTLYKPIKGRAIKEKIGKTFSETLNLQINITPYRSKSVSIITTGKIMSSDQAKILKQLIQNNP